MCGIVAAVSKSGGISADAIGRATRVLRHRGPDAQHVWTAPDGRVGLGHARLSIIDLEGGDQPIANEDGRLRIVVNGELYDFERIREELEREGHGFRTQSDSEIALHLFEDRGARSLHSLRGEFAFAIWDARDGQLFAARDRFGIKPLYYTIHDGTFYMASEIKALAALGVPLRWDRETLYDIHFVSHPPDRTLFAGIYQLPPASYLLTDGEQVRVIPYWDWDYPPAAETHSPDDEREWIARLEHSFEEAVSACRADVPVACYGGGGIDSRRAQFVTLDAAAPCLHALLRPRRLRRRDLAPIGRSAPAPSSAARRTVDRLADHFSDAIHYAERPFVNARSGQIPSQPAVRDSGSRS
jgi:asparagine synthase (glutamine-hydrolysing)